MEYLDGMDLDRLIEAEGPLAPGRAIHILAQVSGALAEAHALGLIHRDIKPANIVLTERADEPDVVKVLDFGLVKTLEPTKEDSVARERIVGTPLYLAPEAITSPSTMDGRADLYAVGAVAYFLVTGTHVFDGVTTLEVCSKHLMEAPSPPSKRLGRPLPADFEALVLACLAKDRDARPASATALRERLLRCAETTPYDVIAARTWWQSRGASLRARPASGGPSHTTMAVDLRERVATP
jgi:serine/threonine-protein kinase